MLAEIDILLVEDDKDDLDLALAALKVTGIARATVVARDGQEALDFIFRRGAFEERDSHSEPKLILLDLKLPKVNGLEVLRQIKENESTRHLPVVMLSSSGRKQDIEECYKAGANSYLVKSVNFERFMKDVQEIGHYWLNLNQSR